MIRFTRNPKQLVSLLAILSSAASLLGQAPASQNGQLTPERIVAEPSLNGELLQRPHWNASGTRLAWIQRSPRPPAAKSNEPPATEVDCIDASKAERGAESGPQRSVLVSPDKIQAALRSVTVPKRADNAEAQPAGPPQLADFAWAPGDRALLLITPVGLVWFDLRSGNARVVATAGSEAGAEPVEDDTLSDARLSPDGRYVSFVRDHALWLASISTGAVRRVTPAGSSELREGEPDWPYRNDLGLTTAYWWSPDSSQVAYLETNDRETAKYKLRFADRHESAIVYPLPGSKLPAVRLYVQAVTGGQRHPVDVGSAAYLPRVSWTPDSRHLAVERLDRRQKVLDLLLADAATGRSRVVVTETDPYWINLGDGPHFLRDGKQFVWLSERSGYRHLYLYDTTGAQVAQLTNGEWEVTSLDAIDEESGQVYFTGTKSPSGRPGPALPGLERQVFRVGLDGTGLTAVTQRPGTHEALFSPNAKFFVDTFSTANAPPRQDLVRGDGSEIVAINENSTPALAQRKLPGVEFLTVKMHMGSEINALMIRPPDFDASRKYPAIVYIAGGPGEQIVRDQWGGDTSLWLRMMAQKGYVIYAQDGHGTAGRGHAFEEPSHLRFSGQEMADERDGVRYLRSLPYIDAARVGIYGWGYGGFLALHAMLDLPIPYKAGIAGAPVTDWRLYDAVFAERYLEDPVRNQDGYLNSSPTENAKNLRGPLLIVHGTVDDRVHIENSLELLNEFLETAKYPSVMFVPDRGNAFEDREARLALYRTMTEFFVKNL